MTRSGPALRHVVLSDLHLGAGYSLLTGADADARPAPLRPSPTLEALARGLRDLVPTLAGDTPPTLVLLGDVLDLAFSSASTGSEALLRFFEQLFPRGETRVFGPEVVYVPGNHDHREWRVIRDALFLDDIRNRTTAELPDRPAVTALFPDRLAPCELATLLLREATGDPACSVGAAYPNLGYRSGDRCVVLHHGHFNEPLYLAVSSLVSRLTDTAATTDADRLERMNGPWIDFLWSSAGDQGGQIAGDLYGAYESSLDAGGTHDLVKRAASMILAHLGGAVPVSAAMPIGRPPFTVTVGGVVEALLDLAVTQAAERERMDHGTVLSSRATEGVRSYLAGTVGEQLGATAWEGGPPTAFAYVFGHTHKPFQDELVVDGFGEPVEVWNTGGWVLDRPITSPVQGASVVLIDDDANVAALRLFNDPLDDDDIGAPRPLGCGGPGDAGNPLLAALHEHFAAPAPVWQRFQAALLSDIHLRADALSRRFFDPATEATS